MKHILMRSEYWVPSLADEILALELSTAQSLHESQIIPDFEGPKKDFNAIRVNFPKTPKRDGVDEPTRQ